MRQRIVLCLFLLLGANTSFAAITGVVMTTEGAPVAGAKVSVVSVELPEARRLRLLAGTPDPAPLATAATDAKGTFTLESPKELVVDLRVDAPGYEPLSRRVERDEEVGAIALRKAEMKSGTIRANGKPVAGAKVVWYYGAAEYVTTTDEQGRYTAPDSRNASRVVVFHRDYALLDETQQMRTAMTFDRTLLAGTTYSGRVVGADGQTPVKGAAITVDGWPLATSTEDGSFTIARLSPKWQAITARAGSLIGMRASTSDVKTIRLGRPATVSGVVRDAKTQAPIAGVVVQAGTASGMLRVDTSAGIAVMTDAKGVYTLALTPGTYRLVTTHPGYDAGQQQVSAAAGQSVTKNFAVPQLARITGSVIDEDKRPVAAAVVSTEDARQADDMMMFREMRLMRAGDTARSGPDGRFTIRIPESEVRVVAAKRGWPQGKSDAVKVTSGERKSGVLIMVPRGFEVTGKVTDRGGRPLSGVAISAAEAQPRAGTMVRFAIGAPQRGDEDNVVRTGSDGTFAMRLKEGTYDLTLRREGYTTKVVRGQQVGSDAKPVETSLDPSVDITGRVVRNGAGVQGANIFSFMGGNASTAVTGPDGSFTLSDLTPGPVRMEVNKEDEFIRESRTFTAPARDVLIEIPPGGRISGRVVDKATRRPLTTFQVGLSGNRSGGGMVMVSPPQMRSFTSDDGSFVLENVTLGPVTLVASAPGYTQASLPNLNVEEGKPISDVVLELDTGSKLTGRVTGPNGEPLANATVRESTGRLPFSTGAEPAASTEANGEYTIEALEPGEKSFEISHPDFLATRKTIEVSGRETRMDVQLSGGQRVTGVVVTDAGVPVVDASVRASSAGGSSSSTRSGPGGAFTFEKLAPGRYNFSAAKSGLAEGTLRDFDITSGAQVRITMSGGATIVGRVTGLPESEYANTMVEARGGTSSTAAPVDAAGNYRIEGAPTGTVRVSAVAGRTFVGRRTSSAKTVELAAGDSRTVDLEFSNDTTISGRVTRNGQPLTNGNVTFLPRNAGPAAGRSSASAVVDERGMYTITGIEDGEYTVQVLDMDRLSPYTTQHQVRGSGTFDIDMKGTRVAGRVVDADTGQPVTNATIQFRAAATESFFGMRAAATDSTGSFQLDSVSPGRYSVTAEKQGYGNQTLDVTVSESGTPDLDFRIARNDGVTVQVVDARDGRLLSAAAIVMDMQGRIVSEELMRFGSSTPEELRLSLAPGTYRATIGASGYAAQTVNLTSPGRQMVRLTPGGMLAIRSRASTPRRARLVDASGQPYLRFGQRLPFFTIDAGTTTLQNVVPGTYTLQILGTNDTVTDSVQAIVVEGQTMTIDV